MASPLDIRRAALLLLDLQRDALHPDGAAARSGLSSHGPGEIETLIGRYQQLADALRAAERPVVWVSTAFRPDYADAAVAAPWLQRRRAAGDFLVQGTWGVELMDGLEPDPGDYTVTKQAHAAFADTPLDRLLTNLGADQCIIAGGGVADSITETVRTAGMLGYRTFVVEDALYPPDAPELGTTGLRILPGGHTTTVADVLAAVERPRVAANDERAAPELALLIIDMQNDFVSPERPSVLYGSGRPFPEDARARMLANVRAAADAVRTRGWPVIHVYTARRADDLDDVHARGSWREDAFPPGVTHVAEGTWGTEIVAELTPQAGDFLVQKKGASGFGLTHLHRLLRNLGVRRCLVAGGSVTGCVRATMFDGIALGYDLTVLGDATYPPESPHVEFLSRWCPVLPTEDALGYWNIHE